MENRLAITNSRRPQQRALDRLTESSSRRTREQSAGKYKIVEVIISQSAYRGGDRHTMILPFEMDSLYGPIGIDEGSSIAARQPSTKTPGRNHPCPCGSGKEHRTCCAQKQTIPWKPAKAGCTTVHEWLTFHQLKLAASMPVQIQAAGIT